jgi:peptide/nickel transport system substrate-binding protein
MAGGLTEEVRMRHPRAQFTGVAAACAAALLATTACSSGDGGSSNEGGSADAVRGGTLNLLGTGDVDYMDPNISYYSVGYYALRLWSRQLFTFPAIDGETTTAAPDLATEMPTTDNGGVSEDGKTYTITIREGAKWNTSPERQVTAEDLVRGVKRTCNPVQPFGGLPNFLTLIEGFQSFCDGFAKVEGNPATIKDYVDSTDLPGVVAKDERTIEFRLTQPATFFVDMLTQPAFSPAPEEVMEYLPGSQELGQNQISDGPYQIDSWEPTKSITFSRNPAWDASTDQIREAYVDKVAINETVTQESIQQQLETGTPAADMAFVTGPPPSQLPRLMQAEDPKLNLGETAASNPYIVFNTVSPNNNGALADVQVRQALSHALNRDNIIQVLGGPEVNPPLTHVLPEAILGSEDFDLYPYDPDMAKQMLADAGFPELTLTYVYRSSSEGERKSFQTVQQDLSKAGVTVEGLASPDADFYTKYLQVPTAAKEGLWDLAPAGWGPDWYGNAALSFFAPLYSGRQSFPPIGSNFGFYDSAKTNDLIMQASMAQSSGEAEALWAEADRQVMADAAFFPITQPLQATYHAEQVNNTIFLSNIQGFDPANVWLAEGKQGG